MASPSDSSPLAFPSHQNSRSLFSESPLAALSSGTGHGGEDFSLSELSITDTPPAKTTYAPPRFSLFGPAQSPRSSSNHVGESEEEEEEDGDVEDERSIQEQGQSHELHPDGSTGGENEPEAADEAVSTPKRSRGHTFESVRSREEELQATLFNMRKLNEVFLNHLTALKAAEVHNRGLVRQVEQSHKLLTSYTTLLAQTEHTTRLLLDPNWKGAEADELYAEELAQMEAREREKEAREEAERLQWEEQERREREEREESEKAAQERAKTERGKSSGLRTRGRGVLSRGGTTSSRGRGSPSQIPHPVSTGLRQPAAGTRGKVISRARGRGA